MPAADLPGLLAGLAELVPVLLEDVLAVLVAVTDDARADVQGENQLDAVVAHLEVVLPAVVLNLLHGDLVFPVRGLRCAGKDKKHDNEPGQTHHPADNRVGWTHGWHLTVAT